jgi:hypothetical protein
VQARGHLIHLREGWIQHAAHAPDLADLLARSAAPFRVLLANVARLHGQPAQSLDELVMFAETAIRMPGPAVRTVLDLEERPDAADDALPHLPEYLHAAERLWAFVDSWRRS